MDNDIRLVTKYMYLFDAGIPKYLVWVLCAIIAGIIISLYFTKKNWYSFLRNTLFCLLFGYVFFVLCVTLIFRDQSESIRVFIRPFWSYHVPNYKLIAELVLNVLLFVPIGFLAAAAMRRTKMLVLTGIACCFSMTIEVLQLLFRRGVCNIDDVIHNTFGFVLGYCIFRICFVMIR